MLGQKLIQFLDEKGWTTGKSNGRTLAYHPPINLGLPANYYLNVSINPYTVDYREHTQRIIEVVAAIYEISKDVLLPNSNTNLRYKNELEVTYLERIIKIQNDLLDYQKALTKQGQALEIVEKENEILKRELKELKQIVSKVSAK